MKHVPDDTIYRLKKSGTRVRKVSGEVGGFITVAQVKDGHRWLATPDEIITEDEWLRDRNKPSDVCDPVNNPTLNNFLF